MIENKPVERTLGVCRSLVAIILLGAALRFLDLGRLSWTDTHPPLYYCLLKISLWVLPDTELGIRVVSALCSIATLVVLIIFVYRHWGRWVIANIGLAWTHVYGLLAVLLPLGFFACYWASQRLRGRPLALKPATLLAAVFGLFLGVAPIVMFFWMIRSKKSGGAELPQAKAIVHLIRCWAVGEM